MQEIRGSLFDELRQAAATAKNDYEIAKQRQEEIEKQLADIVAQSRATSQAQVTFSGLESAAAAYANSMTVFCSNTWARRNKRRFRLQKRESSRLPPRHCRGANQKRCLVLALSLLCGTGLGIGLGILRDLMDRVFRTAKQLETELQIPCVAVVPVVRNEPADHERQGQTSSDCRSQCHRPSQYRGI